ncbi:MAG: ATPase, T2SS/T4P/T4SS family [Rhodobacteraceae bacterium]|nr:ATPase, T2SS/T4P/T4SS family [Paracoccaceae bacterium]
MARATLISGFGRGRQYPVRSSGLIEIPAELREICAAFETGRIIVQTGKQFDPEVGELQEYLAAVFNVEPYIEQAAPQLIADIYLQSEPTGSEIQEESHKRYVARLLKDAADMGASDLKIIRRSRQTDVRVAVAGREINYRDSISVGDGKAIIAYLFDARDEGSGHTTKQQHNFQSFSITPGHTIPLPDRIQKIRGQKGFHEGDAGIQEHMVLRIVFKDDRDVAGLDDLGFDPLVMHDIYGARTLMKGGVIIGGETGDGKSTTIIRSVERLYDEMDGQISVVSIEDPVETRIRRSGVIQIPIQSSGSAEERTANYQDALRHFVRINPHVGVVSEVRDAAGARQMIQFIETGHQVWTTIHIGSVNSILFRMIDMGIQPAELAKPDSITLLMKQSLIPLLCSCAQKEEEKDERFRYRNASGCDRCRSGRGEGAAAAAWAGYRRLIAVGETIVPDAAYLDCVRRNDAVGAWRHWTGSMETGGLGGLTLSTKLNLLANAGLVAPPDARKKGADIHPMDPDHVDDFRSWIDDLD